MALKRKMPTKTRKVNKANPRTGSSLDDFLRDEGILEEVEAAALKRVVALQFEDIIKKERLKKASVAQRMRTSCAALDRLLDPENTPVTLSTLNRAGAQDQHQASTGMTSRRADCGNQRSEG